jgi:glucose-1-phosphate cytidylyltransferase
MKVIILAGGLGTRISEESQARPKPMIEIGGMPILWHIMKSYSSYGITDFIVCCGYKGYVIKEYFANYFLHQSDVTFNLHENKIEFHDQRVEPWLITLVDTGLDTMTGGRLSRIKKYLEHEDTFCLTYGDGLSDVDIPSLLEFHQNHGRCATLTSVLPPGRFGHVEILEDGSVVNFKEKPNGDGARINGGFFVLDKRVFNYLDDDDSLILEQQPMKRLAQDKQLMSYEHNGFWYAMDTLRDKNYLESLWRGGRAPWRNW